MKDFDGILEQEEMIWFQKSKVKHIALGDRNISYIHTSTIIRRRKNRIELLKNDGDNGVTDEHELERLAITYYQCLYSLEDVEKVVENLPHEGSTQLTREEQVNLHKLFSSFEVEQAIRGRGKFKAPGPDGFHLVFY